MVEKGLRPRKKGKVVGNDDVEQNIREIRAILITNAEIFDRCMGSRKQDSYSVFTRYSFDLVSVIVGTADETARFSAYSERSDKFSI